MTQPIVELAQIKLADGVSEADLMRASDTFQIDFLNGQPGFVRRELVRSGEGAYLDIVHWQSRADADAVMQKAQGSDAVGAYFSLMDFDAADVETGVTHCVSLQVHQQA